MQARYGPQPRRPVYRSVPLKLETSLSYQYLPPLNKCGAAAGYAPMRTEPVYRRRKRSREETEMGTATYAVPIAPDHSAVAVALVKYGTPVQARDPYATFVAASASYADAIPRMGPYGAPRRGEGMF